MLLAAAVFLMMQVLCEKAPFRYSDNSRLLYNSRVFHMRVLEDLGFITLKCSPGFFFLLFFQALQTELNILERQSLASIYNYYIDVNVNSFYKWETTITLT